MRTRIGLTIAAIAAALTLALAGCAEAEPVGAPVPTGDSTPAPSTDPAATWLDGGRGIALVTWGSSSTACTPSAADVQASGQTITVTLGAPSADAVCTADFAPRATYIDVPQGMDATKETTVSFQGDGIQGRIALTGLSAAGTADHAGAPSAGWFASDGIVLLTWGSSSCRPIIQDVQEHDGGATVTFQTDATRACTRDLVPRLTVLGVTAPADPAGYTLTLSGDNLDATVPVLG